jgi:mannonate dehydratase
MAAAMRAYRDVGFDGLLAPDHVPLSEHDPDNEIQFGFGLGYIRGLIQAVKREPRMASEDLVAEATT